VDTRERLEEMAEILFCKAQQRKITIAIFLIRQLPEWEAQGAQVARAAAADPGAKEGVALNIVVVAMAVPQETMAYLGPQEATVLLELHLAKGT